MDGTSPNISDMLLNARISFCDVQLSDIFETAICKGTMNFPLHCERRVASFLQDHQLAIPTEGMRLPAKMPSEKISSKHFSSMLSQRLLEKAFAMEKELSSWKLLGVVAALFSLAYIFVTSLIFEYKKSNSQEAIALKKRIREKKTYL